MPHQIRKLAAAPLEKRMKLGLHSDGGGLYLRVKNPEAGKEGKSWIFRYTLNGAAREMGLGAFHALSLADARDKATECRKLLTNDIDPIDAREAERKKQQLEAAKAITFKQCALAYIEDHKAGWRNAKHAEQWETSLETYAYPIIGPLPVQDVDVSLVLKVLEQKKQNCGGKKFWEATPETANRVRNRIESIVDWATAREYRRGENPARWRGHLENLLPRRTKLKGVKHHAALPYDEIGDFIQNLRQQEGMGVDAFEFLILTAARTGEVTGAQWDEFDLAKKIWTIPAGRIKAGREHRVPLSGRAFDIVQGIFNRLDLKPGADDFVFPGRDEEKSLSKMGLLTLLKHMKRRDITVHGFRSSFRDWAAEQTSFSREVAESALAHVNGDKVEQAYRRGDLFEKRRKLMDAWAEYCSKPSVKSENDNVFPIQGERREAA